MSGIIKQGKHFPYCRCTRCKPFFSHKGVFLDIKTNVTSDNDGIHIQFTDPDLFEEVKNSLSVNPNLTLIVHPSGEIDGIIGLTIKLGG